MAQINPTSQLTVDGINYDLRDAEGRELLEKAVEEINNSIAVINNEITKINQEITKINQEINNINQQITRINQSLETINNEINNIKNTITDLGDLAFKDSVTASYTPRGTVKVNAPSVSVVTGQVVTGVSGSGGSWSADVVNKVLIFNSTSSTITPTYGTAITKVSVDAPTATFTGTQDTIESR